MRTLHTLLAGLGLAVILSLLTHPTRAEAPPPPLTSVHTNTITVVCLGDSLTYGSGLTDPESQSYPARLTRLLGAGWVVHNQSHPGATCLAQGDQPLWQTGAIPGSMVLDPHVVLIMLGTNDSKENNWKLADQFLTDYVDLAASFVNMHTRPHVWLCTPLPIFIPSDPSWDNRMRTELIPKIREAGKKLGVPVIDLYGPFQEQARLFPDGVHPNAEGAALMAEIIARAVQAEVRFAP